jgi:conjugative transposon TraN protein
MKKLLFYIALFVSRAVYAQENLPVAYLPLDQTLHFVSPDPIQYVDISTKALVGDLPLKNVLRLRLKDSAGFKDAVITIAGEKFIAQYHVIVGAGNNISCIEIRPEDTRPLDISGIGFSQNQLKTMAMTIFAQPARGRVKKAKAYGIKGQLNDVYSAGDYLFLDISYKNKTSLSYDIDDLRFQIEDNHVTKASNVQSFELKPELTLFNTSAFNKGYRNVFVFRKMSFPGNKVLVAVLSEKQISGRTLTLKISYQDILDADTITN